MKGLTRFEVDLYWRVTKASGNRGPNLSQVELKDFDEISGHKFLWTLVLDKKEMEKYWSSAVLSVVNPPIATPIGPEFQIDEPSQVGSTFHGIFYAFNTLIL